MNLRCATTLHPQPWSVSCLTSFEAVSLDWFNVLQQPAQRRVARNVTQLPSEAIPKILDESIVIEVRGYSITILYHVYRLVLRSKIHLTNFRTIRGSLLMFSRDFKSPHQSTSSSKRQHMTQTRIYEDARIWEHETSFLLSKRRSERVPLQIRERNDEISSLYYTA
ncbi:hypothetical protein BDV97DRAFT_365076 [Delphinella strobiligena]|nr:hypothetical protein BDV97DRAFT_365076 [Delphinella strobiligena]